MDEIHTGTIGQSNYAPSKINIDSPPVPVAKDVPTNRRQRRIDESNARRNAKLAKRLQHKRELLQRRKGKIADSAGYWLVHFPPGKGNLDIAKAIIERLETNDPATIAETFSSIKDFPDWKIEELPGRCETCGCEIKRAVANCAMCVADLDPYELMQ